MNLKDAVKLKLQKKAGALSALASGASTAIKNAPTALKYGALPVAWGVTSTLANTPQGSRPSYYATDLIRNTLEGGLYFAPGIPAPVRVAGMVLNPLGSIKALNRTDPHADRPVGMPHHERYGY
jgi:hypothetical protein